MQSSAGIHVSYPLVEGVYSSTSDYKAKGGEMNFEAHFCSLCIVDDSTAYDYCLADACQIEEDEVYAHTLS